MTNAELNTALYKKMSAEQQKFRDYLVKMPPAEILKHSYEYTVRESILLRFEYSTLSDDQAKALLNCPEPLSEVYFAFDKVNTNYMDTLWNCAEKHADELLMQEQMLSLPYLQDAAYARNHGQLDQFRRSNKANTACKEAIEDAISENYCDNTLYRDAITQVLAQFHPERVAYVLASTCVHAEWDRRISDSNKAWAKTVPLIEGKDSTGTERSVYLEVSSHPGLTDLFINMFRKELQRQKEQPARATPVSGDKRHSVLSQLSSPRPASEAAPKRKDMEL